MADAESLVEIGYLEKSESFLLESRFFPSKVGGKPAWLDLKNIPANLPCGVCGKQCIFLCQLYAPVEGQSEAYHRTLFVFVCRDPGCCTANKCENFIVLRCQLAQENDYFVPEEPTDCPEWHPESAVERFTVTCIVCGCLGSFQCSKCKTTNYCSKEHQIADWKAGHKDTCGTEERKSTNLLFPEFELLTEQEEGAEPKKERTEEERLKEYKKLVKEGKAGTLHGVSDLAMEAFAEAQEDKCLKWFKKRLARCPDQVVRYKRGGEPLWITEPNLPEQTIPDCETCQSPRQFEFQILSTLLSYLNVDSLGESIDWGTLLIYTCKNSCATGPAYKREFLWKQDLL